MNELIIDEYKPCVVDHFKKIPFEKRLLAAKEILMRCPDVVPVIIERGEHRLTPLIDKYKFLVPGDISFGKFNVNVRKYMPNLDPHISIFFFVGDILPPSSAMMNFIYNAYKSSDGFLYVKYMAENTFGN